MSRYTDFKGLNAMAIRGAVAARLYSRGADEVQIGLLLGIGDKSAVRDWFPRPKPSIQSLVDELI
jgi:predicted transcriptional regulator